MKNVFQSILIAASVFFTACNNPETGTEKNNVDTNTTASTKDNSSMPDYDPALDPWNVEAPFAKKFGDTLGIKMFEVTLNVRHYRNSNAHKRNEIFSSLICQLPALPSRLMATFYRLCRK
jgi:hypothetical protein